MANINDFKILKLKNKKMFDLLNFDVKEKINDIDKERIGFYHLVLENITGQFDFPEYQEDSYKIIDTKYNQLINKKAVDDLGIDAVYISENSKGEIDIRLFNFKYRNSFKVDNNISESDISRSTKFLEYILQNKELDTKENEIVHKIINEIIKNLNSNKICNLFLYMVSNESNGFHKNSNEYIKLLENNYGMKLINISLDDITNFFNEKKDGKKSKFIISTNEFLSFQSDEKSTQKSYILKLSLIDLIRITSIDEDLSNNYGMEDDTQIINTKLDLSLLYDNVRGFLGDTKYNLNIINTLEENPQYFFMYNNGITLTAEKIECEPKNSGMKYLFTIENFQIVNGGQTIRSIFNFLEEEHEFDKISKLRESYILVRIFKTNKEDSLKNNIAEYTNSQNSISEVDLKSIDSLQIQIEKYLEEENILYSRKSGDLGKLDKDYIYRISIEKLAQILYSTMGYPDRASNQKRRLFQDYYNSIFKSEAFSMEKSKEVIYKYIEIEKTYKEIKKYKISDQKIFYVIYMIYFSDIEIVEAIYRLEELIKTYDSKVSDARKLIQKGFKDHLDDKMKIIEHGYNLKLI